MRIKKDYNLENLVKDYGFKKKIIVYEYVIEKSKDNKYYSSILVNEAGINDRKIRFYYFNDENEYGIDYAVKIPNVLLQMIKDGIVEE